MNSEGPYKHSTYGHATGDLTRCLACAYAEGRKSTEKDFRELLELADRLKFSGSYFPDGLEDEFDAWKKARGLE